MAKPIKPGAGVKPSSVVWLDNNVSERVRRCNWRVAYAFEHQPDVEGNRGLGPSSRNRKDKNSCRKQA